MAEPLRVLFLGDIVGPEATHHAAERIRELRRDLPADLVIANAENCAITASTPWQGFGMTAELVDVLFEAGVDVITSGNHGWDAADASEVHAHPRVLRPANMADPRPGTGTVLVDVAGSKVTVANLGGASALGRVTPLYPAWCEIAAGAPGPIIVDLHSDETWEKMIFAAAVDGHAAAVLGTHSHEPTHRLHTLPGGTAFVADVGMTGPTGYPGGFPLEHFAAKFKGEDGSHLPPLALAPGPVQLGAVWLEIDGDAATTITRIS